MTSKTPSENTRLSGRRLLFSAALTTTVAAAGAVIGLRRVFHRPLPPTGGRLIAHGLKQPVEVVRDQWGVPHIFANNNHDLFFAQGYVMAQDRLFQMDLSRRLGMGKVSEIVGPLGLPYDRFARYLGWPRAIAAQTADRDQHTDEVMSAFAAGINAYIASQPLPAEFALLAYRPEPWRSEDTAAWGTVLAWGLSVNWETELLRAWLIETVGPEKAADLTPACAPGYLTTLPDESAGRRLAERVLHDYLDALAHLPLGVPPAGQGLGSNNWVVGGAHTADGRPHLANDPHLPASLPPLWYACHLCGGDYHVAGFTMPGIPGIIIGHNEHVAWGVTNAFPDVQDVYIERFDPDDPSRYEVNGEWRTAEMVGETIRVRGRKPVTETVRYTRHGPVFTDLFDARHADLSLRWTMLDAGNHLRAVLATNRAADWNEFRDGLRHWTFPSQNVVYADTAGNIGYMMPGRVPRRRSGQGLAPLPGWTDDGEWLDTIPFEELPVLYNPPDGMIATANNHVAGDSYPYLLSSEWLPDYRARRIRELLAAAAPLRLTDHGRIQNETVSLLARRFLASALPVLTRARADDLDMRDALLRLQQWDGDMRADSATPALFFGLLTHFTRAAVSQAVGREVAESLLGKSPDAGFLLMPFYEMSYELVMRWLESEPPDWVGDVRPLLVPALRQTLDVLRKEYGDDSAGWRWGRLHRIAFVHQLSRIPAIGRLWKPLWLPAGGDGFSINQCDVSPHFPPGPATIIASCRLILDVGDWDAALAALPGGQSGQPVSPHYQDRIAEWQEGRYFPLLFSRDRVVEAAAGVVILTPEGR